MGPERHQKSWGYEDWVVNNDLYCGKLLHFDRAGGKTSLHFHAKKHETMWCTRGSFTIHFVDTNGVPWKSRLSPGETVVITPLLVHRIEALEDGSELVEFSTHHEDSDSYRVAR